MAKDDDVCVFIEATAVDRSEGGFAEGRLAREQLAALAFLAWLFRAIFRWFM